MSGATAARCSICAINYPPTFSKCRVCQGDLTPFSEMAMDSDWRELSDRAQLELQASTAIKWELGPTGLALFKGQIQTMTGADDFIMECEAVCKNPPLGWDGDTETGHRAE